MRHLRNTLYVLSEDAYLTLDGENIVAKQAGKEIGRVPLCELRSTCAKFGFRMRC